MEFNTTSENHIFQRAHTHTHIVNASLSVVLTHIMQNNNQPLDESSNVAHSWVRAESGTEA